jgi:DMSO/TMAO reductase YedYZ molybdopterin-dependent catalytic subunit
MRPTTLAGFALLVLVQPLTAQSPAPLTLIVEGVARNVTAATLRSLPRDSASMTSHDQLAVMYSGYSLAALLRTAGVRTDSLRGPALSSRIVFEAADGYRIVLTLADLDPTLGGRRVLIADRMNGQPLPVAEAPWRVVVVGDQRPARSARQVLRIRVVAEPK